MSERRGHRNGRAHARGQRGQEIYEGEGIPVKLACENCDSKHFRILTKNGKWYAQCVSPDCNWVYTFHMEVTLKGREPDEFDDLGE